jgi:hypothetical protein
LPLPLHPWDDLAGPVPQAGCAAAILDSAMCYELHIHRAAGWLDAEDTPIRFEEWSSYVGASPDFRMDNFAEADLGDGEVLRVEAEGIAVWTGHPTSDSAWFTYGQGTIDVKNPDEPIRRKMFEVATALGARVQGDEGEFYDQAGRIIPDANWDEEGRRATSASGGVDCSLVSFAPAEAP